MYQSWNELIKAEMKKEYFKKIIDFLNVEYNNKVIYPPREDIMKAFLLTPLDKVKVVILGQDPYHEEGQAMGLSFSVHKDQPLPKSLINIYKELYDDLGIKPAKIGDLTPWARQGVLLLNTILTVQKGNALSHNMIGWETFTNEVIKTLNEQNQKIVFILWGSYAISKKALLNNPNHLILTSPHPSPLSAYRGFFGSKPFSKTNKFLYPEVVDWKID